MTMLTHGLDGPVDSTSGLVKGGARAHLSAIKRFCLGTLAILSASGLVASAIALKTAIYFWRHGF